MFLQQAPAETFNYMLLGYSVILGFLAIYTISLVVRFRNLKRDLSLLQEVESESDSSS